MPLMDRRQRREIEAVATQEEVASDDNTQQHNVNGSDSPEDADSDGKINEWTKTLIRLALAAEYQRKPLTRDLIREKVLGRAPRSAFKKVFDETQRELKSVFGMELVELPANEKKTLQEKRAAQKRATASKPVTKWILVSLLTPEYRHSDILPPPAVPTSIQDSTYTAIYTTMVSLIQLNRGSLPDAKFERYLRRLGMEDSTPVAGAERTEQLKKRMRDQGYIDYSEESIGNNGEVEINWFVGPRGKIEIGDAGVKSLVQLVYGNPDGDDGSALTRKIDRSLGVNERQTAAPPPTQKRKRNTQQVDRAGDEESDDDSQRG